MNKQLDSYWPIWSAALLVATTLGALSYKLEVPMLLGQRFLGGLGAAIQIVLLVVYASYLVRAMLTAQNTARLRKITWTIFSIVFFGQLALGLFGFEQFLMTGKLHLPIPALILGGSIYKLKLGFMPILLLSTIIVSGPAWCSQLCYFGALDLHAASNKKRPSRIVHKTTLRIMFLVLLILSAALLRFLDLSYITTVTLAASIGIVGIAILIFVSRRKNTMYHCTVFCPIGTLVQYLKYIHPTRMYIDKQACTLCMKCTPACKYDALHPEQIRKGKPAASCTYCGDCISTCHSQAIRYKFFRFSPSNSHKIWILITVSLHTIFLALARI